MKENDINEPKSYLKILFLFFAPIYLLAFLIASLLLIIGIIGLFKSIILIGLLIIALSLGQIAIELLIMVIKILLKKKYNIKSLLKKGLIYLSCLVIGIIILINEIKEYKIINPKNEDKIIITNKYVMDEDIIIRNLNNKLKFITNDKLNKEFILDISHFETPFKIKIENKENHYFIGYVNQYSYDEWLEIIINNLQKKKIYNYDYNYELTVYSNEKNIQTILKNISRKYEINISKKGNETSIIYLREYPKNVTCDLNEDNIYYCTENELNSTN